MVCCIRPVRCIQLNFDCGALTESFLALLVFADHSLDVKSSPGDVMQMSSIRLPKEQAESIRDSHSSV